MTGAASVRAINPSTARVVSGGAVAAQRRAQRQRDAPPGDADCGFQDRSSLNSTLRILRDGHGRRSCVRRPEECWARARRSCRECCPLLDGTVRASDVPAARPLRRNAKLREIHQPSGGADCSLSATRINRRIELAGRPAPLLLRGARWRLARLDYFMSHGQSDDLSPTPLPRYLTSRGLARTSRAGATRLVLASCAATCEFFHHPSAKCGEGGVT